MRTYSLEQVADASLLDGLDQAIAHEQGSTADVVAHLAEVDKRRLYALRGYDSMHAYCIGRYNLSEDAAYRRIQAARTARQYPRLFHELEQGRLNLSAVCLIAPHLTPKNFEELVEAARRRSNSQIRQWLTARLFAGMVPVPPRPNARQLEVRLPSRPASETQAAALSPVLIDAVGPAPASTSDAGTTTERAIAEEGPLEIEMRFTISREDHALFRYAQALLSHAIPTGDVAAIYRRAIEAAIRECERRKFAATRASSPRKGAEERDPPRAAPTPPPAPARPSRHVRAPVRRAVWLRDGGRCTFLTSSGHRCRERRFLEFDHAVPLARGGPSTVENLRLRCRTHNQEEANRVLGVRWMSERRRRAAVAAAVRRTLLPWDAAGWEPHHGP